VRIAGSSVLDGVDGGIGKIVTVVVDGEGREGFDGMTARRRTECGSENSLRWYCRRSLGVRSGNIGY